MSTLTRLSVAEYDRMVAVGILPTTNRFELIAGRIEQKMPQGPRHNAVVLLTLHALDRLLPPGWHVGKEGPVRIPSEDSEPEPDISVVRGEIRDYLNRHPGPADVVLVVEVADSSLDHDRGVKLAIYARAGIPVYWIVNLIDRQVEVYTEPDQATGQYAAIASHQGGEDVPVVIAGQVVGQIAVAELLP
jgi:Uma2 family endonuclease